MPKLTKLRNMKSHILISTVEHALSASADLSRLMPSCNVVFSAFDVAQEAAFRSASGVDRHALNSSSRAVL